MSPAVKEVGNPFPPLAFSFPVAVKQRRSGESFRLSSVRIASPSFFPLAFSSLITVSLKEKEPDDRPVSRKPFFRRSIASLVSAVFLFQRGDLKRRPLPISFEKATLH